MLLWLTACFRPRIRHLEYCIVIPHLAPYQRLITVFNFNTGATL